MPRFLSQRNKDSILNNKTRKKKSHKTSSSTDSGIQANTPLDSLLERYQEEGRAKLDCDWPTQTADLILKVDDVLFPVHRMVLWDNSVLLGEILKTIMLTSEDDFEIFTLQAMNAQDVGDLLPYFYDQNRKIDDLSVLDILRIAHALEAHKVTKRCESHLINCLETHPIDLLKIAKKYNLERLTEHGIELASRIRRITQYADFTELDVNVQNKIMLKLLDNTEDRMTKLSPLIGRLKASKV